MLKKKKGSTANTSILRRFIILFAIFMKHVGIPKYLHINAIKHVLRNFLRVNVPLELSVYHNV